VLKSVRAIYNKEKITFLDETEIPEDGTEVIVIFEKNSEDKMSGLDAIKALRGSGKGEGLLDELLKSRKEDLELDEKNYRYLRSKE
jgi:hypothetical protein